MGSKTTTPDVYRAIADVSRELGKYGIQKDAVNASQGFNFRGIDAVLDALSAPLAARGLVILPYVEHQQREQVPTKNGGVQFSAVVSVVFTFASSKDGSTCTARFQGEAKDSGDKATSKALSMAYKYMAFQVFCIPVSGLDDADSETPKPSASRTAKKAEAEPEAKESPANESHAATAEPAEEPKKPAAGESSFDDMLALVTNCNDVEQLASMRMAVSKFKSDPRFKDEMKPAYIAAQKRLSGKKED